MSLTATQQIGYLEALQQVSHIIKDIDAHAEDDADFRRRVLADGVLVADE